MFHEVPIGGTMSKTAVSLKAGARYATLMLAELSLSLHVQLVIPALSGYVALIACSSKRPMSLPQPAARCR